MCAVGCDVQKGGTSDAGKIVILSHMHAVEIRTNDECGGIAYVRELYEFRVNSELNAFVYL